MASPQMLPDASTIPSIPSSIANSPSMDPTDSAPEDWSWVRLPDSAADRSIEVLSIPSERTGTPFSLVDEPAVRVSATHTAPGPVFSFAARLQLQPDAEFSISNAYADHSRPNAFQTAATNSSTQGALSSFAVPGSQLHTVLEDAGLIPSRTSTPFSAMSMSSADWDKLAMDTESGEEVLSCESDTELSQNIVNREGFSSPSPSESKKSSVARASRGRTATKRGRRARSDRSLVGRCISNTSPERTAPDARHPDAWNVWNFGPTVADLFPVPLVFQQRRLLFPKAGEATDSPKKDLYTVSSCAHGLNRITPCSRCSSTFLRRSETPRSPSSRDHTPPRPSSWLSSSNAKVVGVVATVGIVVFVVLVKNDSHRFFVKGVSNDALPVVHGSPPPPPTHFGMLTAEMQELWKRVMERLAANGVGSDGVGKAWEAVVDAVAWVVSSGGDVLKGEPRTVVKVHAEGNDLFAKVRERTGLWLV
ncbi:hypothetical protein BJ742DRAFT_741955 [Cladochytrium replicatum]|nr:hypothetical protein BJ742DRAFT_741955 [Cladochytrium replicatum]